MLVGLISGRIDAVQLADLAEDEPPALSAVQALLRDSEAVAMVVFTDHRPPQWVAQPCYLLRQVLVRAPLQRQPTATAASRRERAGATACDDNASPFAYYWPLGASPEL